MNIKLAYFEGKYVNINCYRTLYPLTLQTTGNEDPCFSLINPASTWTCWHNEVADDFGVPPLLVPSLLVPSLLVPWWRWQTGPRRLSGVQVAQIGSDAQGNLASGQCQSEAQWQNQREHRTENRILTGFHLYHSSIFIHTLLHVIKFVSFMNPSLLEWLYPKTLPSWNHVHDWRFHIFLHGTNKTMVWWSTYFCESHGFFLFFFVSMIMTLCSSHVTFGCCMSHLMNTCN